LKGSPDVFRSSDLRAGDKQRRSAGFTLIEVMVALGILVLVTAAVYPQVVVGLRATGTARDITQAKGVGQARLEQMRSMPYYVGREAGDYIDILDTYYRNTTAPTIAPTCTGTMTALPATGWTGYVSAGAPHCPWEPAGPLYRRVINPIQSPGLGAFAMVVSTQFLAGSTPPSPVPPLPGYNSQTAGSDAPASSQVGTTIAVFYRSHGGVKYTTTYSQVERSAPLDPLIQSEAHATTVHVSSSARSWSDWNDGDTDPTETAYEQIQLQAQMGVVDLTGELFTGSRVVTNASPATGSTSLPSLVKGASTNLIAPVDVPYRSDTASDVFLPNGCKWICFGGTRTDQVSAFASDGLPKAGSATVPVRSMITSANRSGFWFDNGRWRNRMKFATGVPMVSLDTTVSNTMPGVRDCAVGGTGATNVTGYMAATGFLHATKDNVADPEIASCATAQSGTVRVLPTTFAPRGVVRITVHRASAYCRARIKSSSSATSDYLATVEYWNGYGYVNAGTIRPSNTSDPLDSVNLDVVVDPSSGLRLRDYVSSWSSLLGDDVIRRNSAKTAEVDVPGVVTLVTEPTRTFSNGWGPNNSDETSAISISVGAVSCQAADNR
jgi:prepilin-type N-terminal cleavage/methylation domain-containing protein